MAKKTKKEIKEEEVVEVEQTTFGDYSLSDLLEEGEGEIENVYD